MQGSALLQYRHASRRDGGGGVVAGGGAQLVGAVVEVELAEHLREGAALAEGDGEALLAAIALDVVALAHHAPRLRPKGGERWVGG